MFINNIPRTKHGVVVVNPITKYLLTHFNGNIIDTASDGGAPHTLTENNTTSDTTNKKYGSASRAFNGSTAFLNTGDSTDWDIFANGTDEWTLACFIRLAVHTGFEIFFEHYEDDNNNWNVRHNHGTGFGAVLNTSGSTVLDTGSGGEITDTNFHHFALIKVNDEYGIYVDGTQVTYVQDVSTDTFTGDFVIGRDNFLGGGSYLNGNLDECILSKENFFNATPVVGLTDTIEVPGGEYTN